MREKKVLSVVPEIVNQADPIVLTRSQVADLLQVTPSCVYELTRRRSKNPLPFFKAGKYIRFEKWAILQWIRDQQKNAA
jgi:predicted DNA-binding transcriptional regulator AlpA